MKQHRKRIKAPLLLRLVSWLFPKVEKVAPWLAKRWFVRLFFTPVRYKVPHGEQEVIATAYSCKMDFEGKKVQVYQWGEGQPVLFVHGWMGRGGQFRKFVPVFTAKGYQVVSFDATAHGKSEGKKSHLMEFTGIIEKLQEKFHFKMIVGHSLGGVAAMHAIHRGVAVDRLIMISSPSLSQKIVNEFLNRLNASDACGEYLDHYIQKKYGHRFDEYSAFHVVKNLRSINLLLIHDHNDKEVDMDNPRAIIQAYPPAKLVTTTGLGHTRILKDEKVVQECLNFINNGKN